jgi:hypothetical protein
MGDLDWETTEIPKVVAKAGAWVQDQIPGVEEPFIKPWMIDLADDRYVLDITRTRSPGMVTATWPERDTPEDGDGTQKLISGTRIPPPNRASASDRRPHAAAAGSRIARRYRTGPYRDASQLGVA